MPWITKPFFLHRIYVVFYKVCGFRNLSYEKRRPRVSVNHVAGGRFQEVTLEALLNKGATHFAWLRPKDRVNEPMNHQNDAWTHGLRLKFKLCLAKNLHRSVEAYVAWPVRSSLILDCSAPVTFSHMDERFRSGHLLILRAAVGWRIQSNVQQSHFPLTWHLRGQGGAFAYKFATGEEARLDAQIVFDGRVSHWIQKPSGA